MFGIIIDCDAKDGYQYYISNPEVLSEGTIEHWMLSSLTVGGVLSDCLSVKDNILLENIPEGEQFLSTIIRAIKTRKKLKMTYQRFDSDAYITTIEPYALKLFQRRWYLLAHNDKYLSTYSLDRMQSVDIINESFKLQKGFSATKYFSEYYGVLVDETPMEHIVLRAFDKTRHYLRTLPLHHSQRIIAENEDSTDFALDLRPTFDFRQALLALAAGIEVLEPLSLRKEIRKMIKDMRRIYKRGGE